jgi:hypothetical protein
MRWRRYHITSKSGKNPVKRGGEESGEQRPMTNANMARGSDEAANGEAEQHKLPGKEAQLDLVLCGVEWAAGTFREIWAWTEMGE